MVSETDRARALLESSRETLARSYDRAPSTWNIRDCAEPQFTREAQDVFDRTLAEQKAKRVHSETRHTMAAQNTEAWTAWAKVIASKEAGRLVLHAVHQILQVTARNLEQRDKRIAELEQRVATLEGSKVTELHPKGRAA